MDFVSSCGVPGSRAIAMLRLHAKRRLARIQTEDGGDLFTVMRASSLWAAEDLIKNSPALSRWHPDYKMLFSAS
jgi:hypothetical protein